jgi:putative membrane protein
MARLFMVTVLLVAGSALAADPATADRDFYAKAAAGGMAEVETGALAQVKGNSAAVRDFGEMMVRDHTKANDKLKQIAGRKNIELPTEPDAQHKAKKQELEAVSGAAFDSAYMQAQVAEHEATESLLKRQIESGADAEAKAWARESLPTVTAHLKRARALATGATASDGGQHRQMVT